MLIPWSFQKWCLHLVQVCWSYKLYSTNIAACCFSGNFWRFCSPRVPPNLWLAAQVTVPVMSSWTSSIHPLVPNMPSQQLRWRTWTWEVWKVWMMTYFSQCGLFVVIFCNLYPLSSIFNIFFFARGLILLMAQILQQLVGGLSSFIKCKTRFWLAQLVGKFRH